MKEVLRSFYPFALRQAADPYITDPRLSQSIEQSPLQSSLHRYHAILLLALHFPLKNGRLFQFLQLPVQLSEDNDLPMQKAELAHRILSLVQSEHANKEKRYH